MSDSLSAKLSKQFNLTLPPDVVAWFDHGEWSNLPDTLFNQPIELRDLLDASSGVVSGGLMLPDTLPFLSDGAGNALCLRFGFDGGVSEVICWNHEGGWWKPFGRTLAEALVLDASFSLIDRVENDREDDDPLIKDYLTFADWAATQITNLNSSLLRDLPRDVRSLLSHLKELDLGQVAISQRQCEQYLTTRLDRLCRKVGGGKIAASVGVSWNEFRRWLVDPQLIPNEQKNALTTVTTIPFDELIYRDWEHAAEEAEAALNLRSDLAWPFAVLGRHYERKGDIDIAVCQYWGALTALGTSQGFTAAWSVLSGTQSKFAAGRLRELSSETVDGDEYLRALTAGRVPSAVRQYWSEKAEQAEKRGDYRTAYERYYKAGWDILASDEIEIVLNHLVEAARRAGSPGLSALAAHHRQAI
jgi:hypothetical protein